MGLIGVLGGMGPLATADFMQRVIALTPASRDQEHLPMLVANLPHIPDRSNAIIGGGEDPLTALQAGMALLNNGGAELIVVPCNSAHHWMDAMRASSAAPILDIAEVSVAAVPADAMRVAVLATGGTLASGFYQARLAARGVMAVIPSVAQQAALAATIALVKAGDVTGASVLLRGVLQALSADGIDVAIMGCTEIPLAAALLAPSAARQSGAASAAGAHVPLAATDMATASPPVSMRLIDSTYELARATVEYAVSRGWNRPA